ncbi:MAG TPA: amino acid adenylation domain-containing protein, partial [Polyangia bacterium]|nr:amino acid adenylation domain-containing protein [Polyangia bacterium]
MKHDERSPDKQAPVRPDSIDALTDSERFRLLQRARSAKLERIAAPAARTIPIGRADRDGVVPLSLAQQRLWFLAQLDGGVGRTHKISGNFRLQGDLDGVALRRALDRIVERHEILRTRFVSSDGAARQVIDPPGGGMALHQADLASWPDGQREAELQAILSREADAPFDLENGPLFRAHLVRLSEAEHVLALSMHHIVSDGWSVGILANELEVLYDAFRSGGPDPLAPLPVQYADFSVWQRDSLDSQLQRQTAYWKQELAGAPDCIELPTDRPHPPQQDHAGGFVSLALDERLTDGLKALGQRHGCTLYMTLLAGWAGLLGRLSGQPEVVVGSPVAGRARPEVARLIGCFVNTIAMRLTVADESRVAGLLAHVKSQVLAAQDHQDLPFEQIVELVQPPRRLSHTPLFQVMFAFQAQSPAGEDEISSGLSISAMSTPRRTAQFELTLELQEADGRLVGGISYAAALFDPDTVERIGTGLQALLAAMIADDQQAVWQLPIMDGGQRRRLIEWGTANVSRRAQLPFHGLFEARAAGAPDATALVHGDRTVSYGQLNAGANRLARHLQRLGVGREVRVGLCLERRPESIVALLATCKAGGAFVPLDPTYPAERLRFMVADASPRVVLVDGAGRAALEGLAGEALIVDLTADAAAWEREPAGDLASAPASDARDGLAYIIYTSGSTGRPKGVMVEQGGLANLIVAQTALFGLEPHSRVLQFASLSFDASISEIGMALASGAALCLADREDLMPGPALARTLAANGITHVTLPPSVLALMAEHEVPPSTRVLVVAGEALPVREARRWAGRVSLFNAYGPTEATVCATAHHHRADDVCHARGTIPIGGPIANVRLYVLDRHRQPVPVGVTGEIYVGGVQVARGYWGRPELTAERFVADSLSPEPGARMYRTGDLGRWLPDGTVEFLGRNDFQVKLRGFRIELGEIETCLGELPGVAAVMVTARRDAAGDSRLVAYFTAEPGAAPEREALRAQASARLPAHMVPAAYVRLEAFPVTSNGKVDRQALPAPGQDAYGERSHERPQGPVEEIVAKVWSEILHVEAVGRHESFFELGGHSLLAVVAVDRLRQAGVDTDVRAIFAGPTVAEVAASARAERGRSSAPPVPPNLIPEGATAITPEMVTLAKLDQEQIDRIVAAVPGGAANVQDIYPLAPLQEGLLFHHLLGGKGDPYVLPTLLAFARRDQLDGFLRTLQALIDRHDMLRTGVVWEGLDEPLQVVHRRATLPVEVAADPAGGVGGGDVAARLKRAGYASRYPIDVRRAPLMRAVIAEDVPNGRWLLLVLAHHLALDHATLEILIHEADDIRAGRGVQLETPVPFREFVWNACLDARSGHHDAFFRELLGDIDEPTAPFGLLTLRDDADGAAITELRRLLPAELSAAVRACARAAGVSAASVMHLAWALVLARVTARSSVVFGTVLFGRMQPGARRTLGMLINTLPVRCDVGGQPVAESLRATQAMLARVIEHEHASLALAQRCSGVPAQTALFTALLNYRHARVEGIGESQAAGDAGGGVQDDGGGDLLWSEDRTNYPVVMSVDDLGEDFALTAQVSAPASAERVCALMETAVAALCATVEQAPATAVADIDVLPAAERRQVLEQWNVTQAHPRVPAVHHRFEACAAKQPEAIALVSGSERVTYGELNARANRLAHHLRRLGVKPEARVGVCVERGAEMVVALLATVKAGGAYVPLDPAYPAERLGHMLRDSAPVAVLLDGVGRAALAGLETGAATVDLELDQELWAGRSVRNPGQKTVGLRPEHPAYVIYTSGSTGTPKGVVVEHGNLTRLFSATEQWFGFGKQDVWTMFHSFAFDFSVWEMWGALAYGGRLVVVGKETARSPRDFYELLCDQGVTVLNQTPSAFQQLVAAQALNERRHALRAVIFGGEALEVSALAAWYAQNDEARTQLVNMYGITETTVHVTYLPLRASDVERTGASPIGERIGDLRVYVLDERRRPAPVGVTGELYVGGAGVARGYLNRPELTAERFVADPFAPEDGARMYKTGDLGRWQGDGKLEYLGRNDAQVKVRGHRIELGEVEARLAEVSGVERAVVVAREDQFGDRRLVAYYAGAQAPSLEALRAHARATLPEYMVPAAYVRLDAFPLTRNGKLDRRALPAPDLESYGSREYDPPRGPVENALAAIWTDVLRVERVGRNDNFFELGGHSLVAVTLVERMRRSGLTADVRAIFTSPTLAALAKAVADTDGGAQGAASPEVVVPPNLIPEQAASIAPEMLTLVQLDQPAIDRIVAAVPGGAANVQDIYPLAPLQEGILFHHLLATGGDAYLTPYLLAFATRPALDEFLRAFQTIVDRHDILRTAVMWEGLDEPVQVVHRRATVPVAEEAIEGAAGQVAAILKERYAPGRYRIPLTEAPLVRGVVTQDGAGGRWLLLLLIHHLIDDATSVKLIAGEIAAIQRGDRLPPAVPFRNFVAEARLGVSRDEHEAFFRKMLREVEEPTAPFDLLEAQGAGGAVSQHRAPLSAMVAGAVRAQAGRFGVSAATVMHLAWSLVLARASARRDVVFGTVLLGRLKAGADADRVIGLLINTLPMRVVIGDQTVVAALRETQETLAQLIRHEHAPLTLARRCSGLSGQVPLFSALLNFRHPAGEQEAASPAAQAVDGSPDPDILETEERTNYPLVLSVDDVGETFVFTAQVAEPVKAERVCRLMARAVAAVVEALAEAPERP